MGRSAARVQKVMVAASPQFFIMPPIGGPLPPLRGPPPPDERWEASLKVVVSFPPTKWDRQGLRQRSSPPCYLPTPFPGVGGERSETEGGGWMGRSAARVQKVQRGRFLRWTGLMAGGFLSLTGPLAPRVVDCPTGNAYKVSVTGLAVCVICDTISSATYFLVSP